VICWWHGKNRGNTHNGETETKVPVVLMFLPSLIFVFFLFLFFFFWFIGFGAVIFLGGAFKCWWRVIMNCGLLCVAIGGGILVFILVLIGNWDTTNNHIFLTLFSIILFYFFLVGKCIFSLHYYNDLFLLS